MLLRTDHDANIAIPTTAKKDDAKMNIPLKSIPQINAKHKKATEYTMTLKNFFMYVIRFSAILSFVPYFKTMELINDKTKNEDKNKIIVKPIWSGT